MAEQKNLLVLVGMMAIIAFVIYFSTNAQESEEKEIEYGFSFTESVIDDSLQTIIHANGSLRESSAYEAFTQYRGSDISYKPPYLQCEWRVFTINITAPEDTEVDIFDINFQHGSNSDHVKPIFAFADGLGIHASTTQKVTVDQSGTAIMTLYTSCVVDWDYFPVFNDPEWVLINE
jgi:hypothetical protein